MLGNIDAAGDPCATRGALARVYEKAMRSKACSGIALEMQSLPGKKLREDNRLIRMRIVRSIEQGGVTGFGDAAKVVDRLDVGLQLGTVPRRKLAEPGWVMAEPFPQLR